MRCVPVFLKEASCLKDTTHTPVRVATIQPHGNLAYDPSLGNRHHQTSRTDAKNRVSAFLRLVQQQRAELAIAPEYFAPVESIEEVLADPATLREDTIYVLPIESIPLDKYNAIYQLAVDEGFEVARTQLDLEKPGTFVNPCAIMYRGQDSFKVFFQAKVFEAAPEYSGLLPGKEVFQINGQDFVLLVLICSDANFSNYHQIWTDALSNGRGAYIAHVQWNPRPDYPIYGQFWASLLNSGRGRDRLVFSLNWAVESKILHGYETMSSVLQSRTRIFRGKIMEKAFLYHERSVAGLHLEHRNEWEIWHVLPPQEHAHIHDICRPYEDVDPAIALRSGIVRSTCFDRRSVPNVFRENVPDDLTSHFWQSCEEYEYHVGAEVPNDHNSLWKLERVCNACLLTEKDRWNEQDVMSRIPTAQLICLNLRNCTDCPYRRLPCNQTRPSWKMATEKVAQCLRRFQESDLCSEQGVRVASTSSYPLNLIHSDDSEAGWLFHGSGREGHNVEKDVASFFQKGGLDKTRRVFDLCHVGVSGNINANNICSEFSDKSDPVDEPQGITNREHAPEFSIVKLDP